ncbi:MAG: DUF3592 domain-containing protein [Clostridia bacterium]|nr:DUF3592 domain-containing protein [Clostridia bacterium]
MRAENKFARFMRTSGPIRFLLPIALVLIVIGIVLFAFNNATKDYVETTGTVTAVNEVAGTDDATEYEIRFSYTVEGTAYNGEITLSQSYTVGESITVYYDPANPSEYSNSKDTALIAIIIIAIGVILLVASIVITVMKVKKNKELDNYVLDDALLEKYRNRALSNEEVEYYCSYDGKTFKPGYIVEDRNRRVVYEAINTKNVPALPREFEFVNHYTNTTATHKVTRPFDTSFNNEVFSTTSTIKFDGANIWEYLHKAGIRIDTDLTSVFPKIRYIISLAGEEIARVETSSQYVHEEDEEGKKIKMPIGRYYYRIWTKELDLELLFLTVFAISETNQTVVE